MLEIRSIMDGLAERRPVFHSEADFQHALAWEIHQRRPDLNLRLEYRPPGSEGRMYVDIWGVTGAQSYAIELKYKTERAIVDVQGERFELLNHSAEDVNRYLFIKDLCRLEEVVSTVPGSTGYAVLLTNVGGYWTARQPRQTIDSAFRIHHGRELTGTLSWGEAAGSGTTRGVEGPLGLTGACTMDWRDYSRVGDGAAGTFRYLLVQIDAMVASGVCTTGSSLPRRPEVVYAGVGVKVSY